MRRSRQGKRSINCAETGLVAKKIHLRPSTDPQEVIFTPGVRHTHLTVMSRSHTYLCQISHLFLIFAHCYSSLVLQDPKADQLYRLMGLFLGCGVYIIYL